MNPAPYSPPLWPVSVVGVAEEDELLRQADPRAGLSPEPGQISLLLLRTRPGITLGSSLTRKPAVLTRIREIPGLAAVRTSPVAGTVGPGGQHWLGFLAVANLPDPCARPLDRLTGSLRCFLEDRLGPWGVELELGRVEGAWCPGFSDLAIAGRKLVGLGYRLTGGWGLVRGVVAVSPPDQTELALLDACHRAFGPGLDYSKLVSLAEIAGLAGTERESAIQLLGGLSQPPAKMSE